MAILFNKQRLCLGSAYITWFNFHSSLMRQYPSATHFMDEETKELRL